MPSASSAPTFDNSTNFDDLLNGAQPNATIAPGFEAVYPLELSGGYSFAYDGVGNFFLDDKANSKEYAFTGSDGVIYGTTGEDYIWYYPAEVAALGVSRMRFGPISSAPAGTQMLFFGTYDAGSEGSIYLPVGAVSEELFEFVYCAYKGDDIGGKIFLAKSMNIDAGVTTLLKTETQFAVTGGVVESCVPIAFKSAYSAL